MLTPAHQVAVALLDHIAYVDADAKFDALLRRYARIAFDEAGLHLDGAPHDVDHAPKLDDRAVAGALDDAPVMSGYGGVNEVAAETPQARKRMILVRAGEARVSHDVRDQDRRELSLFALHRHENLSGRSPILSLSRFREV
jgi:hypothetical protein